VGRFLGMDPFAGNPQVPLTLHRYAYVGGNPSNTADPTGLVSPLSLLLGQAVHKQIGADWVAGNENTTLNDRVSDVSIDALTSDTTRVKATSNWVQKLYFGVGALARPDLAARAEHAIYEIKSIDEYGQGQIKLGYYLDLLQTLDPQSDWRLGLDNEYTPPSSIVLANPAVGDYFIEVDPPEGGVITYTWSPYVDAIRASAGILGMDAIGAAGDFSEAAAVSGGFL